MSRLTKDIGSNGKGVLRQGGRGQFYLVCLGGIYTHEDTAITFVGKEEDISEISEMEKGIFLEMIRMTRRRHGCINQLVGEPKINLISPLQPQPDINLDSAVLMFHTICCLLHKVKFNLKDIKLSISVI